MAALGLTWSQIGIGTTVYSNLRGQVSIPAAVGQRVVHPVSNSTVFPTKEVGHEPSEVEFTLLITAASLAAYIADVRNGAAERKISFMIGATECYIYSYSGDVDPPRCLNPYGSQTRQYDVTARFPMSRSTVFLASDDSPLWGN